MSVKKTGQTESKADKEVTPEAGGKVTSWWLDLIKVAGLPLVTLVLGFVFNSSLNERQANASNTHLYTEMMGRREQADSDLRKDMFKSILDTFMSKDPKLGHAQHLQQEVLNLELLAYNFHESLDIGPLFKDVRSQIPAEETQLNTELRTRLERVAREVTERQLTVISDSGMVERGDTLPNKISSLNAYLTFGAHAVSGSDFKPGLDVSLLCLSMDSTDELKQYHYLTLVTTREKHYRQFKLEIIEYDPKSREVQVRLYVSRVIGRDQCMQPDLSLENNQEIDSSFWVGLFDFPMIDNTRLTHGERCAVSLTALNENVLTVALSYFPGSRASLKDKPYYDDVMHDLVGTHKISETLDH